MANSAFTPAVLTVSGSSSTSSGEKNYVTATDGNASGLWTSSTSPTVTISTSTSTIPDNITKASSLAIAWVSGTTGYARYRFTLDQADYGKKFKIQWDQVYGTAGHWTLQVWSNTASDYTGTSTQLTVQTSAVPGITGTFTTSVDMSGSTAPYIEIRIVASSTSATTIYLNSILMGPGTIVQGAAISEWQSWTPTFSASLGTCTNIYLQYRRVGSSIEIFGRFQTGTTSSSAATIALPLNLTAAESNVKNVVGWFELNVNTVSTIKRGTLNIPNGSNLIYFGADDYAANGTGPFDTLNGNAVIGSNQTVGIYATIPVSQWSGSGTVSLGAGASVEYAYNSDTGTSNNLTAFAYGPDGVAFGSYTSNSTTFGVTTKRVRFQYPIQQDDDIQIEINIGNGWQSLGQLASVMSLQRQYNSGGASSVAYGMYFDRVSGSSTDIDINFGTAGRTTANTGLGTAGETWASASSYKWRVRKAKASSPVGFGKADSTSFGLVGPRRGQQALTFSSTPAGWLLVRAVGVYYQDQDGNHRLKFNICASATSATLIEATLSGVTFKNVSSYFQAIACLPAAASNQGMGYVTANTGTVSVSTASSQGQFRVSGDVELESKPSWA